MSNLCILFGEILVKTEKDATKIHDILKRRIFVDTFDYQPENQLLILDVGFDKLKIIHWLEKYVYKKFSESMPENAFSRLYFKEGQYLSCIYFGNNMYEIMDYPMPEVPFWWQGEV